MHRVEGAYALGIIFADYPDQIYSVRKDSPLIVGLGKDGNLIASDVPAVLKYTRNVFFIENEEIARLTEDTIEFFDVDGQPIEKEAKTIDWDVDAAEKGGYDHFMIKEIHEEPKTVRDTLNPRIKNDTVDIEELGMSDDEIKSISRIRIVACGSAYHTGVTAKYVFEEMARIPVEVDIASEFRYRNPILQENELVIAISQSGETADTKEAVRMARAMGNMTLAIVNVVGSSIARESEKVMYTWAGPEISVATTKAYSAQLIALYLLAMKFADVRGLLSADEMKSLITDLKKLPEQIEMLLGNKERIQKFANRFVAAKDVFFIGRGIDYAIAMEGSLKLKEISYIHSEAYAAGELKHGTIALISEGIPVIALATQQSVYSKVISNIREVKARGAYVILISMDDEITDKSICDVHLNIPKIDDDFAVFEAVVLCQMIAYYASIGKGCNPDQPRNLAKSVTVE
jgi:glucosamine--fructose-6-phosphate aminotransferase (isomerizing)